VCEAMVREPQLIELDGASKRKMYSKQSVRNSVRVKWRFRIGPKK